MISTGKIFRRWYNFISAKIPAGIAPPPDRIDGEDGVGGGLVRLFWLLYASLCRFAVSSRVADVEMKSSFSSLFFLRQRKVLLSQHLLIRLLVVQ